MSRERGAAPHLFDAWEPIAGRIRDSTRLAIFLDFDGTLVRIARLPSWVRLADRTRRVLQKLAARRGVTLAVISGRRRDELRRYIGTRKIHYLGLYGWECNGNAKASVPARRALAGALANLEPELTTRWPGVWVEPKGGSFSIHLLGRDAKTQRRVRRMVSLRLAPWRGTLRVMANLRDIEVAPLSIGDKGQAVRRFLAQSGLRGALPIYFGDDLSDEPAFAAVGRGVSVLVGRRRATRARYRLRGPAEVAAALSRLEAILR